MDEQIKLIKKGWEIWNRILQEKDNESFPIFLLIDDNLTLDAYNAIIRFINIRKIDKYLVLISENAWQKVDKDFEIPPKKIPEECARALLEYYKVYNFDWNFYPFCSELLYNTYNQNEENFTKQDICLKGILRMTSKDLCEEDEGKVCS